MSVDEDEYFDYYFLHLLALTYIYFMAPSSEVLVHQESTLNFSMYVRE